MEKSKDTGNFFAAADAAKLKDHFNGVSMLNASIDDFSVAQSALYNRQTSHRKLKILTHGAQSVLEAVGGITSIIKAILSEIVQKMPIGLAVSFVGLAINLLALTRQAFLVHDSAKKNKKMKKKLAAFISSIEKVIERTPEEEKATDDMLKQLEAELLLLKELHFKEKSKTFWCTVNVIASLLLALSLVFPPLIFAGIGVLLVSLVGGYIDKHHDFVVSRRFAASWNKLKKTFCTKQEEVLIIDEVCEQKEKVKKMAGLYGRFFKTSLSNKSSSIAVEQIPKESDEKSMHLGFA